MVAGGGHWFVSSVAGWCLSSLALLDFQTLPSTISECPLLHCCVGRAAASQRRGRSAQLCGVQPGGSCSCPICHSLPSSSGCSFPSSTNSGSSSQRVDIQGDGRAQLGCGVQPGECLPVDGGDARSSGSSLAEGFGRPGGTAAHATGEDDLHAIELYLLPLSTLSMPPQVNPPGQVPHV